MNLWRSCVYYIVLTKTEVMLQRFYFTFFFTVVVSCLSAQKWNWAVETADPSEVIDVTIGIHGESVVISKGYAHDYHLDVYDSLGQPYNEKIWYFDEWLSDKVYAVETDDTGNVYVVSKQMLDIAPPIKVMREWWDQGDGHGWVEEETPGEPDYHSFIVLEKYSRKLELITQMKLLKADPMEGEGGFGEYDLSVGDFYVDAKGNCWLAGKKKMNSRVCWRENLEFTSADKGCHFLMKIGSEMKQADWISVFEGQDAGDINTMHIAVNKDGICLISGCFAGAMTFGDKLLYGHVPLEVQHFADDEMYLSAVSPFGEILWAQSTGVQSYDEDVVALSGGRFVASGRCVNADYIGSTKLPKSDMNVMFLLEIDPKTGKHGKLYLNDTSAINSLQAGSNNDFYCDFQRGNSSYVLFIYRFDSKMQPELVSRYLASDPVSASRSGCICYSGTWSGTAAFGFRPYDAYLPGDLSRSAGFLAKFEIVKVK